MWFRGQVISTDGTKIKINLGTRLLKVNITKIRKDETLSSSKPGLGAPSLEDGLVKDRMAEDDSEVPKTFKRQTAKPTLPEAEPLTLLSLICDSQHANWNCVTKARSMYLRF